MDVEERIFTCRLIEQMEGNPCCTERLGLHNNSTYHGIPVEDLNETNVESELNRIPTLGIQNA